MHLGSSGLSGSGRYLRDARLERGVRNRTALARTTITPSRTCQPSPLGEAASFTASVGGGVVPGVPVAPATLPSGVGVGVGVGPGRTDPDGVGVGVGVGCGCRGGRGWCGGRGRRRGWGGGRSGGRGRSRGWGGGRSRGWGWCGGRRRGRGWGWCGSRRRCRSRRRRGCGSRRRRGRWGRRRSAGIPAEQDVAEALP